MEVTAEKLKQYGFEETQLDNVKKLIESEIVPHYNNVAFTNAENILKDVSTSVETLTGIKRGEAKYKDYLQNASTTFISGLESSKRQSLEKLEKDLQAKLADTDDLSKKTIDELKLKLDEAQKQLVGIDEIKAKALKYDETEQELSKIKITQAFATVEPKWNDKTDKVLLSLYWDKVKTDILAKYEIGNNDAGELIAINKENKHDSHKLADLINKDAKIKELTTVDPAKGTGANPKGEGKLLDGVPFQVLSTDTDEDIQKKVIDYLLNVKKFGRTSTEFSKGNLELMKLINEKRTSH